MNTSKLYVLTTEDFHLPLHASGGIVSTQSAGNLPQLLWPDGTVCWFANLYLIQGYLLISSTSGRQLAVDTLDSEMRTLRVAAGIDDEEVCMHAFRHRFATKTLIELILSQKYKTENDLRSAILSTETLKVQLMEWLGVSSMAMLNHYIHLAFEELADYKETLSKLQISKVVDAMEAKLKDLDRRFSSITTAEVRKELLGTMDVFSAAALDLRTALRGTDSKTTL